MADADAAVRAEQPEPSVPVFPPSVRWAMLARCLAVQGAFNYELMLGNGIGFCVEPALRRLPGGIDGAPYREALARHSAFFNSHPYLAGLAIGAVSRLELDNTPARRIVLFRNALCGPLGSVGDRLVWAAWLPACSLVALLLFGLGVAPTGVVLGFLVLYNSAHLALRYWALNAGWREGLHVAKALGHPVLQHGPRYIGRGAAIVGGLALPLAAHRAIGGGSLWSPVPLAVAVATPVLAFLLVRAHGRVAGWRAVLTVLVLFALYSVVVR